MHVKDLRELLCSMLIGDASLHQNKKDSVYFSCAHSIKQEDYLVFKRDLISDMLKDHNIERELNISYYKANIKDKYYPSCRFTFPWKKHLPVLRRKVYKDRKQYGYLLSQMHSPLHLTIWFMDDGNEDRSYNKSRIDGSKIARSPRYRLFIYSFTEGEANLAVKWFEYYWNITPRIQHQKQGPILRFTVRDSKKLFEIMRPYIDQLESMKNKFRWSYDCV